MDLLTWLKAMKTYHLEVGKDHARREYVSGLIARNKEYHFDDCAYEIIGPPNGERIFTDEEAELVNEITAFHYCEEMFIQVLQHIEELNSDEE